jgi:plastocyanin
MSSAVAAVPVARRRRAASRYFLLAGLTMLLLAPSFAGHSTPPTVRIVQFSNGNIPPGGGSATNVTVNMTDAPSYNPSSLVAVAGGLIDFQVSNTGSLNHTFTVSNVPNYVIPPTLSPAELNAFFAANGTMLNLAVAPGSTSFFNLSIPSTDAGMSFEIVSIVPYQFQAGMRGFLNLTATASGPPVELTASTNDALRFLPDAMVVNVTTFPVNVAIQITNLGGASHTFSLEAQSNNSLSPGNFSTYFQDHPPLVDVAMGGPGVPVWANFTVVAPGAYEYICKIIPHFASGMFGWLYVGVPAPAPPQPPSTAIVQAGVLIGAGSLLGIGVIFAVAASYTGRLPRRPPGQIH